MACGDNGRALADFSQKIRDLTTQALDEQHNATLDYVRVVKLKKWMRDKHPTIKWDGRRVTNTERLAHAAIAGKSDFLPREASSIADRGHNCCLIVFSILLDLECGHLINLFAQKRVVDTRLPIPRLSTLKDMLEGIPGSESIAERFYERQWKFCPAFFSKDMDVEFCEKQIIPVCRTEHIKKGGTADVWQISVQAEFVTSTLRKEVEGDEYASYDDRDYGPCYLFAKKVFEARNQKYFTNEKTAFDGLRQIPSVIKRLGCYSHRVPVTRTAHPGHHLATKTTADSKTTMNLLLEYGNFDLRHIFGLKVPPMFPRPTISFWKDLFEVADAVSEIHEFKHGGNDFYGWHADIKPDNIIEVRDKLKLADPGLACFKKQESYGKDTAPTARLLGGTDTFGAPEMHHVDAHQTVDIWSLGCVFSMAATWVVLGYQGTHQYQLVREKALSSLAKKSEGTHTPSKAQKPDKRDCFHNDTNVLREVTGWHALLRNFCRKTDPITVEVIDLIDQHMLLQNPEQRIKAGNLCAKLKEIVTSANKKLSEATANDSPEARKQQEHMENLLEEIGNIETEQESEVSAPDSNHLLVTGLPVNRGALKARINDLTYHKSSHRFEPMLGTPSRHIIPGTVVQKPVAVPSDLLDIDRASSPQSPQSGSVPPLPKGMVMTPPRTPTQTITRQSTSGQLIRSDTAALRLSRPFIGMVPPRARVTQNIIQAREKIEQERGTGLFGKGKPVKDRFLGDHFINRDIKFLVDDAESMAEHWDTATFVLETLILKAHGQDEDGPDLAFVKHTARLSSVKDSNKYRKLMESLRGQSKRNAKTNMKTALESTFAEYISKVRQPVKRSKLKDLTVIVLTDGLWTDMKDPDELVEAIKQFQMDLTSAMGTMPRHRQVTVQFVQFGHDEDAAEKLRLLDDDPEVGDVIDCERFIVYGDVFKMLLGSFVEQMDKEDNEEDSLSSTPNSPTPQTFGPRLSVTTTSESIDNLVRRMPSSPEHSGLGLQPNLRRANGA